MKKYVICSFFIFVQAIALAQFNKGSKVLIDYQGQWYPGKILEVKENKSYLVTYDDYDASWNEVVTSDRLKLKDVTTNTQNSPVSANQSTNTLVNVSGEKKAVEMCECLKKMMKTQKQEDKSRCLNMQEEHVVALGKGSEQYLQYKKLVSDCEKEISNTKSATSSVSGKEPSTYEEKVKAVCDCFNEAKTNRGKTPECYKKQSDFSKSVGDKKTDFTKETNMCAN